jgi:hypothetical protein
MELQHHLNIRLITAQWWWMEEVGGMEGAWVSMDPLDTQLTRDGEEIKYLVIITAVQQLEQWLMKK